MTYLFFHVIHSFKRGLWECKGSEDEEDSHGEDGEADKGIDYAREASIEAPRQTFHTGRFEKPIGIGDRDSQCEYACCCETDSEDKCSGFFVQKIMN